MAMLWETATGQPVHFPLVTARAISSPCVVQISSPSSSSSAPCPAIVLHPFRSSSTRSLLPRHFALLQNCIPSIVRPRPAPTESSRDASLSVSRFNCLSMSDDASSTRDLYRTFSRRSIASLGSRSDLD